MKDLLYFWYNYSSKIWEQAGNHETLCPCYCLTFLEIIDNKPLFFILLHLQDPTRREIDPYSASERDQTRHCLSTGPAKGTPTSGGGLIAFRIYINCDQQTLPVVGISGWPLILRLLALMTGLKFTLLHGCLILLSHQHNNAISSLSVVFLNPALGSFHLIPHPSYYWFFYLHGTTTFETTMLSTVPNKDNRLPYYFILHALLLRNYMYKMYNGWSL